MQPIDHTLDVRKGIVTHLRADAQLTALVSSARIYGEVPEAKPVWPFIRLGIITTPWEASGQGGSQHRVTVHAFAKGPFTDAVLRIAKCVVTAMRSLTLDNLDLVQNEWVGSQPFTDGDKGDDWHYAIEFDIVAVETD